jgi:hypothetical protein
MTWICAYCYRALLKGNLPPDWDLVFQSPICPDCLARAKREHPDDWPRVVKCGEYANGKPDPRVCTRCGACCQAFGIIESGKWLNDVMPGVTEDHGLGYPTMTVRDDGSCICLNREKDGITGCLIYDQRPEICIRLKPGSYWCLFARNRMG